MWRDLGVTRLLREFTPEWATGILIAVTLLGDLAVIIPVVGILYLWDVVSTVRDQTGPPLCSNRTAVLIAVVFGGLSLIVVLETIFAMPRPPSALHPVAASPYGFPSGHTMAATIFWGSFAIWGPLSTRRHRFMVAALIVLVVGGSRLALGVHYLPDVIAAIAFGSIYLAVLVSAASDHPRRAFTIAIAIALIAVIVTEGSSRGLLAFAGTASAALGWWVVERPHVQYWVMTTTARLPTSKAR